MAQKAIEVILARQLADLLAMPVFIVDPQGVLLFYNQSAERILGLRFSETGEMPASEWSTAFEPSDEAGAAVDPDTLPLMVALRDRCPTHGRLRIRGMDGVARLIEVTAFPLVGQADRFLGALALFWEVDA